MKTLKENTSEFLNEVKSVLDNADLDYESCMSAYTITSNNHKGCEKAVSYLETQKFSIKKISEALTEIWGEFIYNIQSKQVRGDDKFNLAAKMIASQLAFERISSYSWSSRYDKHTDKTWYIDETVTFTLN